MERDQSANVKSIVRLDKVANDASEGVVAVYKHKLPHIGLLGQPSV
jgi:hypothetical protein